MAFLNIHKGKKHVLIVIFSLVFFTTTLKIEAQPDSLFFIQPEVPIVPIWLQVNEAGMFINQVSFTNWNAGGVNSISAVLYAKARAKYKQDGMFWNTTLSGRYGINKQQGEMLKKTDDIVELKSNFGYRNSEESNWFYSARFNFSTQFSNGFNYPNTDRPISRFMAPGYLFFGAGIEYGKNIETMSLYMSPLTMKTTFVLDDELSNAGSFGVDPAIYDMEGNIIRRGSSTRKELGILLTNAFETELFENIQFNNLLSLYTDYLNRFGNVDIDWEINFNFVVNNYVKASLGSHIRYDNDVKNKVTIAQTNEVTVEEGAKVQWKQLLGIGVQVDF
ncbi:MAG: DUF3078 domain-containing protein [Winogradskyella sp.]|nr:DUF3078 domain-containing protein [Winogradskyella sp.]